MNITDETDVLIQALCSECSYTVPSSRIPCAPIEKDFNEEGRVVLDKINNPQHGWIARTKTKCTNACGSYKCQPIDISVAPKHRQDY